MENYLYKAIIFFSKSVPGKISFVSGCLGLLYIIRYILSRNIPKFSEHSSKKSISTSFLRQLFNIIPIVIPSFTSTEAMCIYALSSLVIVRTFISIFVSDLNGKLLKAILAVNSHQFLRRVILI